MWLLLPLLAALSFYLFQEERSLLLSSLFLVSVLCITSFSLSSEILLFLLLVFLLGLWMETNTNPLLGFIFLLGAFFTFLSTSMIALFISIEILSMTVLIVVNLYIQDQYCGILYYLYSGLFSALFVLSLVYLALGWVYALKFLHFVLFAKLGLVPFHLLLPSIYNHLSPQVLLLLDIPYKIVLFWTLYRLHLEALDWSLWIVACLLVGAWGSLRYQNLLSILIYSSLFNYGLILILIDYQECGPLLYYFFIYSFNVVLYLSLITAKYMDRRFENRIYRIFWFLLLLNLIGIPPFNGFFIKYYVLAWTWAHGAYLLFFCAFLGILFLTYTYLRLWISMMIGARPLLLEVSPDRSTLLWPVLLTLSTLPLLF